ncbi:MAG: hypothetical protein R3F55_25685 [Alphaproteobacteria bacterium]
MVPDRLDVGAFGRDWTRILVPMSGRVAVIGGGSGGTGGGGGLRRLTG